MGWLGDEIAESRVSLLSSEFLIHNGYPVDFVKILLVFFVLLGESLKKHGDFLILERFLQRDLAFEILNQELLLL